MAATFSSCVHLHEMVHQCACCESRKDYTNWQFIGQDVAISEQCERNGIQTIHNVSCTHDKNFIVAGFRYQLKLY